MYDATATSYSKMMDSEIELPIYSQALGRLHERIEGLPGSIIDTACGSGHMLAMYHQKYDAERALVGVDLSPSMVAIADDRLRPFGRAEVGDMTDLVGLESGSAAGLVNFFALHHVDGDGVQKAFNDWFRILAAGGQMLVGAWEGEGVIDYGDESDIVAFRYKSDELGAWAQAAGFEVLRCVSEPVEDFPMDAVYLECRRAG